MSRNELGGYATLGGFVLCGIIIGIGVAINIDTSTVSLLAGTAVGIIVAIPPAVVITWLLLNRKPQPPQGQPPAAPQVTEQHLHIHLAPGESMPTRGELLQRLARQTGDYEQARQMIAAGRVTVEGSTKSG